MSQNKILKLGSTIEVDDSSQDYLEEFTEFTRNTRFIGVHLFFDYSPETYMFYKLDDILLHGKNRDNYFYFFEDSNGKVYILDVNDDVVRGGKSVYSKELNFQFFINSISNVVIQRLNKGVSRSNFNLSFESNYYEDLSLLYYIVRNYDHIPGDQIKKIYLDLRKKLFVK